MTVTGRLSFRDYWRRQKGYPASPPPRVLVHNWVLVAGLVEKHQPPTPPLYTPSSISIFKFNPGLCYCGYEYLPNVFKSRLGALVSCAAITARLSRNQDDRVSGFMQLFISAPGQSDSPLGFNFRHAARAEKKKQRCTRTFTAKMEAGARRR